MHASALSSSTERKHWVHVEHAPALQLEDAAEHPESGREGTHFLMDTPMEASPTVRGGGIPHRGRVSVYAAPERPGAPVGTQVGAMRLIPGQHICPRRRNGEQRDPRRPIGERLQVLEDPPPLIAGPQRRIARTGPPSADLREPPAGCTRMRSIDRWAAPVTSLPSHPSARGNAPRRDGPLALWPEGAFHRFDSGRRLSGQRTLRLPSTAQRA
jgi:hypothetical protein